MLELAVPEQQSSILGVPGKKQRTSAVPSMLSVCPGPHRTVTFSKQNLRVESSTSASLALFTSSAPKSGKSSRTPAPRITCTVLEPIYAHAHRDACESLHLAHAHTLSLPSFLSPGYRTLFLSCWRDTQALGPPDSPGLWWRVVASLSLSLPPIFHSFVRSSCIVVSFFSSFFLEHAFVS